MASFRKELVADVQLLLGADAHECFDIPLLERTEHVVDFLHGSLLGRGAAVTGVCSLVLSRCSANPARHGPRRPGRPARRSSRGCAARTGSWQVAGSLYSRVTGPMCAKRILARLHRVSYRTAEFATRARLGLQRKVSSHVLLDLRPARSVGNSPIRSRLCGRVTRPVTGCVPVDLRRGDA